MTKTNYIRSVFILLLIALAIIASVNVISISQMKKITPTTTYSEIVEMWGEPLKPSGYGYIETKWRLANGDEIWVTFHYSEKSGEKYVTGYIIK